MTAATVEAASLALELALEHPSAIALADQLEGLADDVRRPAATRAAADRLADLTLYRALLVERYGASAGVPPLSRIVAADQLYGDLTILAIA